MATTAALKARRKLPSTKQKFVCPICNDDIEDPSPKVPGQDSVFCEGLCNTWLHRRCTGLPKSAFDILSSNSESFCCPHCALSKLKAEIINLKMTVESLTSQVKKLVTSEAITIASFLRSFYSEEEIGYPSSTWTYILSSSAKPDWESRPVKFLCFYFPYYYSSTTFFRV